MPFPIICPFDDASGYELIEFLAQHGIGSIDPLTTNIIPAQDSVYTLGDSQHTFAEIWGALIGGIVSPDGTKFLFLGNNNITGFIPQTNIQINTNTGINISLLDGVVQYSGFLELDFPATASDPLLVYGRPGLLELGREAAPLGNITTQGTLKIKAGTNLKAGTFVANGTTEVVVGNTAFTANSVMIPSLKTVGGTPAPVYISSTTPGTSFGIKSSAANTSTYNYIIVETF